MDAKLESLIGEGKRLLTVRPDCHLTSNDYTAALFLAKLYANGYNVELEQLEKCIGRMRIAVETGAYPTHLLSA